METKARQGTRPVHVLRGNIVHCRARAQTANTLDLHQCGRGGAQEAGEVAWAASGGLGRLEVIGSCVGSRACCGVVWSAILYA